MLNRIILILLFFIIYGCMSKDVFVQEDLSPRFEKAMKYFVKGKYSRAKDQFNSIIISDNGSKLASDAQYYMAESMFQLKEYDEASISFDKFIRFATNYQKIEESRYRICECAVLSSLNYKKDQSSTIEALGLLQDFIDDYPNSVYIKLAEQSVVDIRNKMAEKDYETAKLYLKLDQFDAALIYYNGIIQNYYDTDFHDKSHVGIILTHYLNDNLDLAKEYMNNNSEKIKSLEQRNIGKSIIDNNNSHFDKILRLYK